MEGVFTDGLLQFRKYALLQYSHKAWINFTHDNQNLQNLYASYQSYKLDPGSYS